MEEKERYELKSYNEAFCQIHDTESDEWYLRKDLVKDLLNQQDKRIKELEAKLVESENKLKGFVELFDKKQHENYEEFCEIMQLKQQLICEIMQLKQSQNQTAIAELEKVKGFLLEKIEEKQSCFDSGNYNDFADGVKTICEIMLISIEKQINELKEMNNG